MCMHYDFKLIYIKLDIKKKGLYSVLITSLAEDSV